MKKAREPERTYGAKVEPDGSFRLEDVVPGSYRFSYRLGGRSVAVQAIASVEVVVGEIPGGRSDEPLDLGVIELKVTQPR